MGIEPLSSTDADSGVQPASCAATPHRPASTRQRGNGIATTAYSPNRSGPARARSGGTARAVSSPGANGTVVHETIYHAAGSDSPQAPPVRDLQRLIEEAGRVPVERDTLYHEVVRDKPAERKWATGRRLEVVN